MTRIERWTGALACLLQSASGMTNEGFANWLGVAIRTVSYWHSRPDTVPGNSNQEILAAALDRVSDAVRSRFFRMVADSLKKAGIPSTGNVVVDVVSDAANSVANDPLLTSGPVGCESIESLQEEMALLARAGGMAAFDMFTSARRLRDEARKLAESTRRPGDLADLYVIVGQGTALMASTAFDLGHWNDSAALARASTQYADLAGHASLKAWTYGLQMTLANWRNEPDAALTYFARAMRAAPDGEPKLRLRYIASRSHALLADAESVAEVLEAARRDRDMAASRADDLSGSVGGEFAFGEARAAACAAAAWLDLRNGEQAARYAREALQVYEALPLSRRPYSQINGTQIDVAAAHLHMRDRDGAGEALQGVLDLPAQKRNVSLTGRLEKVGRLLTTPAWRNDSEAQQLAERISVWLAETSARPLS
ncbi:hypothetical protein [Micromonospora inyonensis]|uniref:Uncharacterized protein n=1 Tax=Micromonospora inyonensis TaxID=47866 RepID=A0A1C6R751_9ACTN|nr:hypothetical protein [Micromonospora inyonensis]SCL12849.1 hypothetical protein GA0074694_0033 [Micromonospora inyonensis]